MLSIVVGICEGSELGRPPVTVTTPSDRTGVSADTADGGGAVWAWDAAIVARAMAVATATGVLFLLFMGLALFL